MLIESDNKFTRKYDENAIEAYKFFSNPLNDVLKKISDKHFGTEGTNKLNQKAIVNDITENLKIMELSEQSLSHYTRAMRLPSIDIFLGIVKYCEYHIPNFNADYLLGLSEGMTKENHSINNVLGFNNKVIEKLLEFKNTTNINTAEERVNLIRPFSLLVETPSFVKFLKSLNWLIFTKNLPQLATYKEYLENRESINAFLLEREMRECVRELMEKLDK